MVNFVNNANQAQAVAASEGMVSTGAVTKEMEQLDLKPKLDRTEMVKKLIETNNSKDFSSKLLKDLITNVSQSGLMFEGITSVVQNRTPEKKPSESENKPAEYADSVTLKSMPGQDKIIGVKGIGKRAADAREQIKQQWVEIEEQLKTQGKTKQEISMMEQQFKSSQTEKQVLSVLKEAAIMYYLDSDTQLNKIIRRRGFAEAMQLTDIETAEKAAALAKEDLKGFVKEELENQLIHKTFTQDGEFSECYKLVKIGEMVGVDSEAWVDRIWPDKKENHGLNLMDVPPEVTSGLVVDVRTDQESQRERKKFEFKEEDSQDIMLNRLRAIYMQMALNPNLGVSVKMWFKLWKLKNGMLQLKIFTKDMDAQVKQEAKLLAKIKTMEILDEALHEQATFFGKGPDRDVAEQKTKTCLKNLERLGFELTDQEFGEMRTKARKDILGVAEQELAKAKGIKKQEQLSKVIANLKEAV